VRRVSFFGGVEHTIHDYGYLAVSGGLVLENFGLPVPGETLLISGAIAAAQGTLDIWILLLLAWAAAVLGQTIGWAIGYWGGHRLVAKHGGRVGITADQLARVERYFDRYGGFVIIFARFVVVLRQLNGIVAGTLEMGWARFLLLNAVGAALWVGWWGLLAYWLGHRVLEFVRDIGRIEPVLIALAALVLAVVAARIIRRRRRG
jgi:membrane protein DedA with SNARE-associated domain